VIGDVKGYFVFEAGCGELALRLLVLWRGRVRLFRDLLLGWMP
jgi:hypothetical protein